MTQHRTVIDTSLSSLTTLVNGPRLFRLKISVPTILFPPVIDGIVLRWISLTSVTQHRTVIDTSLSSLTTLVNGPRLFRLKISVLMKNGLMKSLCNLLGCVKTRTAPYHPESDGMVERFNRTCLMMLSMFVNDRRDNWNELLPFVMYAYRTSVHESTVYSHFRLMMGEECSLPQDVSTDELRTNREEDVAPHPFATWVRDALEVAYDHVRQSLKRTAARRKRLYDVKAVDRKFPVGSWVLRYYPPAAQKKLGSPWVGPQQVVRMATGHTVGIQKDPEAPIIFIHVDDLKICPSPDRPAWTPEASKARSLCASTVAFRPGYHVSDSDSSPSVDVSSWNNLSTPASSSDIHLKLDQPIDLTGHILSPFYAREFNYQECRFNSVAHLMCYRYAVLHGLKTFATAVRKWARPLTEFPTSRFQTLGWNSQCRSVLREIYSHLCLTDIAVKTALLESGPRPFSLSCLPPWGGLCDVSTTEIGANLVNDILIETRVQLVAERLTAPRWLLPVRARRELRHTTR